MPVSETNVWVGGLTLLLLGMAWLELLGRGALGYLAPFVDKVSHSPLAGACCSDCSIWGVRCGFGSPAFAGSLTGVHPVFAPLTACPALAFVGGWTPFPPQHLRSDPFLHARAALHCCLAPRPRSQREVFGPRKAGFTQPRPDL